MARPFILSCGFYILFLTIAFAAGPYDGNWTGAANGIMTGGKGSGGGLCSGSITATIKDNILTGSMQLGRTNPPFSGKVGPDGTFNGHVAGFVATGKFSGDSFGGIYTSTANCNEWRMTMSRSARSN